MELSRPSRPGCRRPGRLAGRCSTVLLLHLRNIHCHLCRSRLVHCFPDSGPADKPIPSVPCLFAGVKAGNPEAEAFVVLRFRADFSGCDSHQITVSAKTKDEHRLNERRKQRRKQRHKQRRTSDSAAETTLPCDAANQTGMRNEGAGCTDQGDASCKA